jgi:hypothetical protein
MSKNPTTRMQFPELDARYNVGLALRSDLFRAVIDADEMPETGALEDALLDVDEFRSEEDLFGSDEESTAKAALFLSALNSAIAAACEAAWLVLR